MARDFQLIFTESDYYTGEQLTDEMVLRSTSRLGYELPNSLISLLRVKNGGTLRSQCVPVEFENSWAPDHIEVSGILGLGDGTWRMDSDDGSSYMIDEWGYPDIGVVFATTPAGGHVALMLDYREASQRVEPCVVFVDEDRVPRNLAPTFESFLSKLTDCKNFDERLDALR